MEYSDCVVVLTHTYSMIALIIFSFGLYGISKVTKKKEILGSTEFIKSI